MSLIIKGMELSKSCDSCDLIQFDDEGFEAQCPLSPYYRWCGTPPDYRPEGCRLVEIPTPHGRLIDADILLDTIRYGAGVRDFCNKKCKSQDCQNCVIKSVYKIIREAPTVIEAEVSE